MLQRRGRSLNVSKRLHAARLRARGHKLRTIAARLGVSVARVGQLLEPLTREQYERAGAVRSGQQVERVNV